jgi:hypothetical protein
MRNEPRLEYTYRSLPGVYPQVIWLGRRDGTYFVLASRRGCGDSSQKDTHAVLVN